MAIGMFDKILGFIGFEEVEEQVKEEPAEKTEALQQVKRKNAPVVSLHTGRQLRVVVCEPASFDEAQNIADNLKNRRAVVVNLEKAGAEQARRIVDFISGTTFALSGDMQKVGQNIFLFVPNNIDIANEATRETKDKSIFSWARSQ
ncbi:cell division protein SepF [Desulforamulus profundi]|uniref:Cell division protein SepF n=1 Tax=Desulforamulus profundi TaxID=1383067 RepID=A0A2C6L347_9FIRM|nr:cell division protein SepF [Desulforamulus profundi]PHJ38831.1 cell division protein SepF [Desulforamulus profundi]